jgi:hypothetical protein
MNYWNTRVVSNFLPPIDQRKRAEINDRVNQLKKHSLPKKDDNMNRSLATTSLNKTG